jgi:RHS repeat-associated protein
MTSAGASTLSYDGRGNLRSDGVSTWGYDAENRLRGTAAGASLTYDPLGRLYQTTTASGTTTRYLYDGDQVIGEYSGSALLRRYVRGAGSDEPIARYNSSASTTPDYFLADHQGSIIATTNSAGAVLTKFSYDEYGAPGPTNQGLFQYTGQVYLADLSLYHYKARAYSPFYGRFLQTDPTGYDDGLNWYAYVGNDPLNRSDPLGTVAKSASDAANQGPCEGDWDLPGMCSAIVGGDSGGGTVKSGQGGRNAVPTSNAEPLPDEVYLPGFPSDQVLFGIFPIVRAATFILRGDLRALPPSKDMLIKAEERIGSAANKVDRYHSTMDSPLIQRSVARYGERFWQRGGDGNWYAHFRAAGRFNGKSGTYEYIVDTSGRITHQLFKP